MLFRSPTTSPKAQQTTTATPQPLRGQGRHLRVATSRPREPTTRVATSAQVSPPSSSSLPSDADSPTPIPTDTPMTPHGHSRPHPPALPCHTHANTPRVWSPPCPSNPQTSTTHDGPLLSRPHTTGPPPHHQTHPPTPLLFIIYIIVLI